MSWSALDTEVRPKRRVPRPSLRALGKAGKGFAGPRLCLSLRGERGTGALYAFVWTPCPFYPFSSRPSPHGRATELPLRMPGADRVLCWHEACDSPGIILTRQPTSEAWFSLILIIPSIGGVGPMVNLQIAGETLQAG